MGELGQVTYHKFENSIVIHVSDLTGTNRTAVIHKSDARFSKAEAAIVLNDADALKALAFNAAIAEVAYLLGANRKRGKE